jgi:alpha-tubulin suppressor-like RCC1 family protein
MEVPLSDKGELWVWGDNFFGQIGDVNVSTYREPIYEKAGPYDEYGELVDGLVRDVDNDVYTPKYIMGNVKAAYAREDSSFAITNDGKLYAWGKNECGRLCDGTTENRPLPTFIMDGVLYVDSGRNQTTVILMRQLNIRISWRINPPF